jgi:hypothetical protein
MACLAERNSYGRVLARHTVDLTEVAAITAAST